MLSILKPHSHLSSGLNGAVEADEPDVLLSSRLLGLHQAGGPVDAHYQAAGNLGVEGA